MNVRRFTFRDISGNFLCKFIKLLEKSVREVDADFDKHFVYVLITNDVTVY